MIQPAPLKPGVTLDSLPPSPAPQPLTALFPAFSPEARSARPEASLIRGRALVFWDPSVPALHVGVEGRRVGKAFARGALERAGYGASRR